MEIPKPLKQLWDQWDIRIAILLSLFLQTFLILVAPLRKRTSSNWVTLPLWSAYLLADTVAMFTVGLISSSESDIAKKSNSNATNSALGVLVSSSPINNATKSNGTDNNADLLAFWAPFLLAHLGGPDTITALALEDNELWRRHLFSLVSQFVTALYVFFQSLPHNKLWLPTLLMFMAGLIKYLERTRSLYLASAEIFRDSMLTEPDPGPNYAKLMEEYVSKKEAKLPTRIEMLPEPDRIVKASNKVKTGNLTDLQVVQYAYRYFETFRGLVVDLIFSFRERNQSRDFFLARSADDAFRLVEVELNFMYDVLFTKFPVVYSRLGYNRSGYCCRILSSVAIIVSLVLFHNISKKGFEGFDVAVTYTLLIGGITLDVIAFIMILFSDWPVVALKRSPDVDKSSDLSLTSKVLLKLLHFQTSRNNIFFKQFMSRRWSESVSTYNLIHYCLHQPSSRRKTIYEYLGLIGFLDHIWYVERQRFTTPLKNFIFEELKAKSEMADDLETSKEICSAKGEWVLRIEGLSGTPLFAFVTEVDYDESLILWHIATELCYQEEKGSNDAPDDPSAKYREFAKQMSDYMIYLLVMHPNMMSAVSGIGLIRFRDTCAELTKFWNSRKIKRKTPWFQSGDLRKKEAEDLQKGACKRILDVNTEVKPVTIKGDRSKSVLFDASILAKELKKEGLFLKKGDRWVVMSKVWVELLSYAATHVRSKSHAQQLCKGGELITVVWLLMAHFGLGDQFQINEGHARAKLIVGK